MLVFTLFQYLNKLATTNVYSFSSSRKMFHLLKWRISCFMQLGQVLHYQPFLNLKSQWISICSIVSGHVTWFRFWINTEIDCLSLGRNLPLGYLIITFSEQSPGTIDPKLTSNFLCSWLVLNYWSSCPLEWWDYGCVSWLRHNLDICFPTLLWLLKKLKVLMFISLFLGDCNRNEYWLKSYFEY